MASKKDTDLFFEWVNDKSTRENSYNKEIVGYDEHVEWFNKKLASGNCFFYIFYNDDDKPVGQVRIEKDLTKEEAVISISVAADHRGRGYGTEMIRKATGDFLSRHRSFVILAYVFKRNQISYKSFVAAGYSVMKEDVIQDIPSYILYEMLQHGK